MARFSRYVVILLMLLFVSCQEGGEAGDLFGQWQQQGNSNRYVSFSGSVVWLKSTTDGNIFGNFQHRGDSLFIQFYSAEGLTTDTTLVEDIFGFRPLNDIRLKIDRLDGDMLVLSQKGRGWSFRKY